MDNDGGDGVAFRSRADRVLVNRSIESLQAGQVCRFGREGAVQAGRRRQGGGS